MKANIDPDRLWYVATFKPRKAEDALHSIHAAGFDAYLPRKRLDRWSKRLKIRIEFDAPLMPPYLFVGFKPDACHFEFARACDGVGSFLRSAEGTPLRIPPEVLTVILIAETNLEYDETERAKKAKREAVERMFPPGSAVRLLNDLNGLLSQFGGTVVEAKRDKVKVDFGRFTSWLDRDEVEAA